MAQQQHQQQQNPQSSLLDDALYCEEEHWCEEDEEDSYYSNNINHRPPLLLDLDLFWEDEELGSLFSKEEQNHLHFNLETNPSLAKARREAIAWILEVIAHYSFSALTAVLAVNYLDRFLFTFHFQRDKPWMTQLVAVACLSLAAKVEETQVPLLLDLQVEESRYVFEAKTIQRMEILVLSTLQWKMNPVTPISFLDFMTRRLGLKSHLCCEFLKRCECLTLSLISDCRFMCYLPSVMATATMLHVINGIEPCIGVEYQNQLLGILGINKDIVEDCHKLIQEHTSRGLGHHLNKRKFRSMPGSPNGVIDVSFSSDSSNDSWAVEAVTVAAASVSSSPEPLSKKSRRVEEHHVQCLKHAAPP
ncbi:cyclin-D3-1-like [Cornus florida]|uniref:cyclin-D3-1-like n=1 Tax=Cornus florida TaxID=4283 RepID=UPI00289B0F5B|nr:cyclin-D3-1-like [Cornus florida]